MTELNQWCFACGPANPIGLKLEFYEQDNQYWTTFTAGPEHQGYDGIMHGGIVSTLLDEVMARYIWAQGLEAVTAKLEIRYRQQTPVGVPLTICAQVERQSGRIYQLSGKISLPDGSVTAEGKATVVAKR